MFISIAVAVGIQVVAAGLTYLLSDEETESADKGPWSGDPQRYRPVDGDPVPVIFGTVDIAPAVVWSGSVKQLSDGPYSVVIDVNRGGGGTNEINALPIHWVLAAGPVDSISEVHIKLDNEFPLTLHGSASPSDSLDLMSPGDAEGIDAKWLPSDYDVDPDEYNVPHSLDVKILPGLQNSAVTGFSNSNQWGDVGFRHVTSMVGLIVGDKSYVVDTEGLHQSGATPGSLRMRVTRIFSRSFGEASWYDSKAASPDGRDMNPIHIIRNCHTDQLWGTVKLDVSQIDDASFKAAADFMYDQGIFVSARLSAAEDTEKFLAQMYAVCNATPYIEPTTGRLNIAIAGDDYTTASLLRLGDWNSSGQMTRQYGKDQTTRMTVKYTKRYTRATGDDTTPLAPDIDRTFSQTHAAGYDRYGEVELTHDYTEVHSSEIASKLATRDLLQSSRPLAALSVSVLWGVEEARDLRPGSPFIWGSAASEIPDIIYRVTSIDFGSGVDPSIQIEAIEDAFAFHSPLEPDIPDTEWEDPSRPPEPATPRESFQLPLWLWWQIDLETDSYAELADHKDDGNRPYGLAAGRPNQDARDFGLWADGFTRVERARFTQFLDLKYSITRLATEIEFEGDLNLDFGVGVTPILLAGDELMAVTGWNATTKKATVCRGWLDTVPTFLPISPSADTVCIMGALYDGGNRFSRFYATDKRLVSSSVDIKALTRTSAGQLIPADAPTDTLEMGGVSTPYRSRAPLAPTYVRGAQPPSGYPNILITWVIRDRLEPPLCDRPASGSKSPSGFTYTLKVYKASGGGALRTVTGISDDEWLYSEAMQNVDNSVGDDLIAQIWAVDSGGLESWQTYTRLIER